MLPCPFQDSNLSGAVLCALCHAGNCRGINAVNLTDGLDGLAIVPVMIVYVCLA